jgi:hypothetical protein
MAQPVKTGKKEIFEETRIIEDNLKEINAVKRRCKGYCAII